MTNTTNTVREQTARLLATENITVIQDPQAQTAYFDLQNRTLCLPVWRDMTAAMYDMLIGHEVGHALFTPNGNGGWVDSAKRIAADAGFAGVEAAEYTAKTFLNIVEDARIERLIKERFPGLRRDFFTAYTEFAGRDLFSLKGRNPNTLGLADRLNIHFKIGFVQPIQFTPAEAVFVQRMETAVTWEDVVAIAADLFEFKPQKDTEPQTSGTGKGKSGIPQGDTGEAQSGSSVADADGETAEGEGEAQSGGTEGGEDGNGNSRPNGENRSDSGSDADAKGEAGTQSGSQDGVNQNPVTPSAAETASALDTAMEQNRDTNSYGTARQYSVVDPTMKSSEWVVPFSEFMAAMRAWESGSLIGKEGYGYGDAKSGKQSLARSLEQAEGFISQFVESTKDSVQAFVREFEMRKTADEHRRTVESKSGRLDMDQAWKYRISDNLFKTATTMRDGKSHGFVMFIDWSGSMQGQMEQTMRQLFILFQFCRKAGVPFDVYAFGWGKNYQSVFPDHPAGSHYSEGEELGRYQRALAPRKSTQLLHILSSRGSQRDLKDAFRYCMACTLASDYYAPTPVTLGGSTPLQGALVIGRQIVRQFKEETKVQIVNTVVLTDGDATDNIVSGGYWSGIPVLRENHREWAMGGDNVHNTTGLLLKWFRDTTGANIIGVFVTSQFTQAHSRHDAPATVGDAARKQFRKDGWCALPADGYSEYFLLRGKMVDENAAMDAFKQQSGTNMTASQIKSEYMKAVASRKATRGLIGRFVEIVA